jgi:hypothetical protein
MDRVRPIRSDFDLAREKVPPVAQRILTAVPAVMQTRPKFGCGLHRGGLTALSACPSKSAPAPVVIDTM